MEYFGNLGSDASILTDVDSALAHLRAERYADGQIGIVGFCFGGRVSFLVALRRALGAAVGFYGGGLVNARFPQFPALVDEVASLQTPWLGLFGDQDASIPVADVETLRAALAAVAPVDTEIVRYPDAGHGFHCDRRDDYRPDDAADAWRRARLVRHSPEVDLKQDRQRSRPPTPRSDSKGPRATLPARASE